jgi:hypothetical protein
MANGFGTSPFVLPNMFQPPGQALERGLAMQERRNERQYDIDFRNQRLKEADDWRKLNLIQELTNLDKYQTGEAAADAIGNQKASEILQRYTSMAGSLSPAELQGKITEDMQKTIGGMQSLKSELATSDKDISSIKQLFPGINTAKLRQEHRKEILGRRLKNGTDFVNPLDVNPSSFQLNNPDFLSYFVDDPKKLFTDSIRNPKFTEKGVTVAMGSPSSYTSMEGNLPFFRKLNYDPKTDVDKGFLKRGINPSMDVVKEPTTFRGKQTEVLGKGPFSVFEESNPLELRSLARQKYNDYDLMSDDEKETARREVALDYVNEIDKSGFQFKSATKPPHISVNAGGGGSGSGGGAVKGNLIDKIDLSYYGSPKNGRIDFADVKIIPADLQAVLKSSGIDISDAESFQIEIEDGKIMAVTPAGGKRIDRVAVENAQKKFNTEGQKQAQPDFETTIPKVRQPEIGKPKGGETIAEKMRRLANQK